MTEQYGLSPRQTIDHKYTTQEGATLPIHNSYFIKPNEFKSEMHFINSSGFDLLVLTADGMRLCSDATGQREDGNCYFVVKYTLGGDVELNVSNSVEDDPALRKQLQSIEAIVDSYRYTNGPHQRNRAEAIVEFHYRIECTDIAHFTHGVWIPTVGVHLYRSTKRNGRCSHLGRSRFAEVLLFNDNFENQEEVSQAAGCGVVYYVSDEHNVDPIVVCNRHFSGVLYPEYEPDEPSGVHIYNVGQRTDVSNKRLTNIVFIPVAEFKANGIFHNVRALEEAVEVFARKLKAPKDAVEYNEVLQNLRCTFPEFYKYFPVEKKPFDVKEFMGNIFDGMAMAKKIQSTFG